MKNYKLFIHSKNRSSNELLNNFNIFLSNGIICGKNENINISVIYFQMLNSMYNIKSNSFSIRIYNISNPSNPTTINISIPDGNYSVITLEKKLNLLLSGYIRVEYDFSLNKFIYYNITLNDGVEIVPNNCSKILGFNYTTLIDDLGTTSDNFINLLDYNHIIIKSSDLKFKDLVQDNIDPNLIKGETKLSNILFMINRSDYEPFKMINYSNQDGDNNFSFNLYNKYINTINFQLYNERNELITNADDYIIGLKIDIYEDDKNLYKEYGIQILSLLNDIYKLLINIFFRLSRSNNEDG